MRKYRKGDAVRIQSREWIDAQEKDEDGDIAKTGPAVIFGMFRYAGRTAKITAVLSDGIYRLDMDNGEWQWPEWVFDTNYTGNEPLSAEDAIRAMLDGATLYNQYGAPCVWDKDAFVLLESDGTRFCTLDEYTALCRRFPKRERRMTPEEAKAWVESDASLGWVVSYHKMPWSLPRYFTYGSDIAGYRRARILPDMSGVDESTIQGFEVEEE